MKLEETELTQIREARQKFTEAKLALGDLELNKQMILDEVRTLKAQFKVIEENLIEKYGEDSTINTDTGEITKKDMQPLQKVT